MVPIFQQGDRWTAWVASVSVLFRSKERGAKNEEQESKSTIKNGASKRAGRGCGESKETRADKAVDFENHLLACHA